MGDYNKKVKPYLNTNPELDDAVFRLWGHWSCTGIDINSAMKEFFKASAISPNIGRLEHYIPHCLQVSRRCEESVKKISRSYPFLEKELRPDKFAFMGLIEDSFYLIGGNGKNNENGEDSNPYHEILTFIQMLYMGLEELAKDMAMHGLASEILEVEQSKGKFLDIQAPQRNISLDILTGIDFLCTRDYLPDTKGSYEDCVKFRIEDIKKRRRDSTHPLIVGLDNGGEEKLLRLINKIYELEKGKIPVEKLQIK